MLTAQVNMSYALCISLKKLYSFNIMYLSVLPCYKRLSGASHIPL